MAEQNNTPQGGFGQATLLNFRSLIEEDAADVQTLIRLDPDRRSAVLSLARLRSLLVTSAIAVVRRGGDLGNRGSIVALAECSYVQRVTGGLGLIGDALVDRGSPPISGEQELRIRMALIDCLVTWADMQGFRKTEYFGPSAEGSERNRLVEMGFDEIVEGSRFTRYRRSPTAAA